MFAGKRAALKPIYDKLLTIGLAAAGQDAKACPCKTIVPLYREHVFAEIKPATNSRIDLGLALGADATESSGAHRSGEGTRRATASRTASRSNRSIRWTSSSSGG